MPSFGITNKGYINKWIFGGSPISYTINATSCLYGVPGLTNVLSAPGDLYCKNLTVNTTLLPTVCISGGYSTFKLMCSGTLTLNSGGLINASGAIINGGRVLSSAGGAGYVDAQYASITAPTGSLGGSGSGGAGSSSGNGSPGYPTDPLKHQISAGGSGGAGASEGYTGGTGGNSFFRPDQNSLFQPSVYNDALIWCDPFYGDAISPRLFPTRLNGGGGGGGEGGGTGYGGGAGGGVCYIAADRLMLNGGGISADGQLGGWESGPITGAVSGGGGGGLIILVCSEVVWGDSGSTVHAVGANITNTLNPQGTILLFSDQLVASFTGTMTKSDYDTALQAYQSRD